jgi:uncharacterized RDD family membrane protein YckC
MLGMTDSDGRLGVVGEDLAMYCTVCGNQTQGGAQFCANCGTRLSPASEPTSPVSPTSPPTPMPLLTSPPPGSDFPPGYGPPSTPSYASAANVRLDPVLNAPLAPWWKRFLAVIIDWAILGAGYLVVLGVVGALINAHRSTTTTTTTSTNSGSFLLGVLVLLILAAIPNSLYFGLMNGSRRGQTVGKIALSISVRDATNGQSIGFWRAWGRLLISTVFQMVLYIPWILDNLAPLWDPRRQAWHDKVAHSVVIDLKP